MGLSVLLLSNGRQTWVNYDSMRPMSPLLRQSHPLSRFLAGCALLFVALATTLYWAQLGLIILSMLLIRQLDDNWRNIGRMFALLPWFIVPIFLLHAFLSPGELVLPAIPLPLTREGISQGLWLGLRFTAIFVAAMLLFRLLHRSEWLRGILSLPLFGRNAIAYLLMFTAMRRSIADQLGQMRRQWRLRPDWRRAAQFLLAAFREASVSGRQQAWALWLRWPAKREGVYVATLAGHDELRSLLLSIAWIIFALVALVVGLA